MRDPILRHVAQPAVDRFGLDPRRSAEGCADVFAMLAVAASAIMMATAGAATTGVPAAVHVLCALLGRWYCRGAAREGPAGAAGGIGGMLHAMMRAGMLVDLAHTAAIVVLVIALGLAQGHGVTLFRICLDGAETATLLCSLYLGICRKPPPRRRARDRAPARAAWT